MATAINLLKQTWQEWSRDKASRLAAALSYYAIFSIAPLLLIAIFLAGQIFNEHEAQAKIQKQLRTTFGEESAVFIENMLKSAGHNRHEGLLGTLLGLVLLVYAAASVFNSLQDALNTIWEVQPHPDMGWRIFIHTRILSFFMIPVVGVAALASVLSTSIIQYISRYFRHTPLIHFTFHTANNLSTVVVFALLFALIFKFLPDAEVHWRDAWTGAFITSLLFSIGRWGLGFYLTRPNVTSVYGAAGSLVVLLIFVFYSAQIFFFGAEFTHVYARHRGRPIKPNRYAVRLAVADRIHQGLHCDPADVKKI